ncbi:RidA family protein [Hoeflea sp.]|uniref:RidA family protein n=1 Tax=Hoeflea sp. TaxID=1940281 RepID=UPI003B52459C
MTDITRIEPGAHFAAATGNGRTLYISGQVADTRDGSLEVQTREVLAKIDDLLEKGGSSRSKLMMVTVLLPHITDFADFNAVWDDWVDRDNLPARATYEARLAFPGLRIEIAAVAEIG